MVEFDYESADADADTVAAVVAEISGNELKPLSDEEREWRRLEHEQFLAQSRERDRQQWLAYQQRQAEAAEAARIQDRQRADGERAERSRKLQEQLRQDSANQLRDAQLASLHRASLEQQQFRRAAIKSARFAHQRQALENALAHFSPPKEPPEPNVVIFSEDDGSADFGSRNFDVAKWSKKPRSWW